MRSAVVPVIVRPMMVRGPWGLGALCKVLMPLEEALHLFHDGDGADDNGEQDRNFEIQHVVTVTSCSEGASRPCHALRCASRPGLAFTAACLLSSAALLVDVSRSPA